MSGSSEKAMPVDLRCRQDRILVLLNVLLKRTLQDLGFFSFINLSRPQQLTAGNRDQALSLWSGCTDSKTLDYQRTNPRKYQMVRTHTKETTWIQDPASPNHQYHPVHVASSKQQTKQKYKPNHQQTGLPLTQSFPSEEKQTNTNKNSAQISPYTKLTQTTGPTSGRQKPKGRNNSTFFKERVQLSLKPRKRRPQTQ